MPDPVDTLSFAELVERFGLQIDDWAAATPKIAAWASGTIAGGPTGDGRYPLPTGTDDDVLWPCPAKIVLDAQILAAAPADLQPYVDEADAARDQAVAVATMLQGIIVMTPDGSSGFVDADGNVVFEILPDGTMRNIDYLATKAALAGVQAQMPVLAKLAATVVTALSVDDRFGIADPDGYVVFEVLPDGSIRNADFQAAKSAIVALQAGTAGAKLIAAGKSVDDTTGFIDPDGNVAFEVRADGTIANVDYEGFKAAVGSVAAVQPVLNRPYRLTAALAHILTYGQSLSIGTAAAAISTVAGIGWAKMFQGGLRSRDAATDAAFYASLVGLKEAGEITDSSYGETISYGAAEMIHQLATDEDGLDLATLGQQMLFSCPGEGTQSVLDLSEGGSWWPRVEDDLANGQSLAAGAPYLLQALNWIQGERDTDLQTAPATYQARLLQLVVDLNAAAEAATGVPWSVPVVSYQLASHRTYGRSPVIAEALLDLCETRADFALSTPTYILPHVADGKHLNANSYRRLGGYHGIALKRWLIDGLTPRHLRPLEPTWFQDSVIVPFDVPVGPLTIDTTQVADPGSYGFNLVDAAGAAITISGVTLMGDRVVIKAAADIPSGATLRYAWGSAAMTTAGPTAGPRGNLRDNQGAVLTFHAERMDNWAPIFSKVRP